MPHAENDHKSKMLTGLIGCANTLRIKSERNIPSPDYDKFPEMKRFLLKLAHGELVGDNDAIINQYLALPEEEIIGWVKLGRERKTEMN